MSVIIPVYNGAGTVARAIESALAQTYPRAVEIIVADDGSTDATAEILEHYADRITTLRLPHQGVAAVRNAAVRASHGELLAFLDADDTWLAEKLTRTVSLLMKDPSCVLAYHDGFEADQVGTIVRRSNYPDGHSGAPSLEELISYSSPGLPILFDSVVVRRQVFDRVNGFNEQLVSAEDVWFQMNARELGHFCYLAEPLMVRKKGTSPAREDWYIAGAFTLRNLIRARYGSTVHSEHLKIVLKWAADEALARNERSLARRRYWAAAMQEPFRGKTWLALAATFAPLSLLRVVAVVIFPRSQWLRIAAAGNGGQPRNLPAASSSVKESRA
ncbi:MAG TPA: glycosyltransferase family A protein [Candidatus Binataceae bacterium]|nr:glycosyltransferase family A protein [Candidatus Binataceae bacterium]